jgi:hypothetical protein
MKITRLVCARQLPNTKQLTKALAKLPPSDIVITPGGLLKYQLPADLKTVRGWNSTENSLHVMTAFAERQMRNTIPRLLRIKSRYITLGVDVYYEKPADTAAELVAVLDVATGRIIRWTGKSFPRTDEEHDILHVPIKTHFLRLAGERVLLLGCHDLNVWSGRSRANQDPNGRRRQRCDEMRALVQKFRPTIVLQHPHATDTPRTWTVAWAGIRRTFPNLKAWAAGIGWFHEKGGEIRATLEEVCAHTKSANVSEVII